MLSHLLINLILFSYIFCIFISLTGPGVTVKHSEDCVVDLMQLPAHEDAQTALPRHGLVLVVSALARVDGLGVAGAPGQRRHVPGHDDRPHGVVSRHLDLVLGLQLEKVRSLVFVLLPARLTGPRVA